MSFARRGDMVRVYKILLSPEDRSPQLPPDTGKLPLEMRVKGRLLDESAQKGEKVRVETAIGREVTGILEETDPAWGHGFGRPLPEMEVIKQDLRGFMRPPAREKNS